MQLLFPPFRLDPSGEQLWCDDELLPLRPKPFAILRYLIEHPGRLVRREELRQAVWPNTHVGEASLRVQIREIRVVLGDNAGAPRVIETVAGRGYRFLPAVMRSPVDRLDLPVEQSETLDNRRKILIGRNTELMRLKHCMAQVSSRKSQVVFAVGEAGIGKSTLVEAFLEQAAAENDLWIGRGQCVDQRRSSEPYLPLLDLLRSLCNSLDGARVVEILRQQAPSWLAQMPGVVSEAEFDTLQLKVQSVGQQRMLREMAEAVEKLGAQRVVVLVLEDLHWSDPSTLAWLDFFARRGRPARVLAIGTFRPLGLLAQDHPLRAMAGELFDRYCHELALRPLSAPEVAEYVAQRIGADADDQAALGEVGHTIQKRTEGNPLFVVNVVNGLLTNLKTRCPEAAESVGGLRTMLDNSAHLVPATIEETITQHLMRLSDHERHLLEIASIAGVEFSAGAVAAGAQAPLAEIEETCAALAKRMSFLETAGDTEWPDGTVAAKFRFRHSLYREVVAARVTASRRAPLHRRIGERQETAYGARTVEIAAELAWHFEEGRDADRALRYRRLAAQNAWQQSAFQETIEHLTAALTIVGRLPDSQMRIRLELELNVALAAAFQNARGWGASELERTYTRIEKLCQKIEEPQQLLVARMGIMTFAIGRGDWGRAHVLAEQNLRLAEIIGDPAQLARSRRAVGHCRFFLGRFEDARADLELAISLFGRSKNPHSLLYGRNVAVDAGTVLSWTLEVLGRSDQAMTTMRQALSLAEEQSHVQDLALATCFATLLYWSRKDWQALEIWSRRTMVLASENDIPFYRAFGTHFQGVAIAEQGEPEQGLPLIREGISACRAMGTLAGFTAMLLVLAQTCERAGKIEEGLEALAEAFEFVKTNDEQAWEAELLRVKGELLLKRRDSLQRGASIKRIERKAEECFLTAREVARGQRARKWELRAATSLCTFWKHHGAKKNEARDVLAAAYEGITEGADTSDVQAAKSLLSELSSL